MVDFIVIDARGEEWGRYCYPGVAAQVVERCNADPALVALAPFRVAGLVREPNNKRNRWRRCRNARIAYGWTPPPFREWLRGSAPDSYSAGPIDLRQPFLELLNKDRRNG